MRGGLRPRLAASGWLRAVATLIVVVGLDQLTKAWIRADIAPGDRRSVFFGIDLVHVRNRGVAFGFFAGSRPIWVIVTAAVLCLLLGYFLLHSERPLLWLPVGLLLGGAIGNLVDRLVHGTVTDFIKLPFWPAFNVADMSITFGVLCLLYVLEGPPRRHRTDDARA
jgi:signal peptidase II